MSKLKKILLSIAAVILLGAGLLFAVLPVFGTVRTHAVVAFGTAVDSFMNNSGVFISNIRDRILSYSSQTLGIDTELDPTVVINLTNNERTKAGVGQLTTNSALTEAARLKVDDMFKRQYFEHISPDGNGPEYLAGQAGYDYVLIGENLALGNFKDEADLLAAWMASPGHRENILNPRFEQIGVAVERGTYQGKTVWLAVQEFGKPLSDCPTVDPILKSSVDNLRQQADSLSADLANRRRELDSMYQRTPAETQVYNEKVNEYNAEVAKYNSVTKELSAKIELYNTEVRSFNGCIKG